MSDERTCPAWVLGRVRTGISNDIITSMRPLLQPNNPFRIFFISALISIGSLAGVWYFLGARGAFLTFVLILVEITFSFDNAIINARILATMNRFWQKMFITVGILIAVFGMRLVFPIALVMLTTGLGAGHVIDLALHNPTQYAHELDRAHPLISSFGGMFLLMLSLAFLFDPSRKIRWINIIERPLQTLGKWWVYTLVSLGVLLVVTVAPWNTHPRDTLIAGMLGILLQLGLSKLNDFFTAAQKHKAKTANPMVAGLMAFLYLQILDASFSFDGVLGAFAVTQDVVLIAIGLGVGALWVRSLTLFMVRRSVLHAYRYLEHGAHYTIGILAFVLLGGLFADIPEMIAGLAGIAIVLAAVIDSIAATKADKGAHAHTS